MRHRNVWAGGLALGLGLCVAGMALGQDPPPDGGNWFSRLFSRGGTTAARKDEKEPVAPVVAVPTPSKAQVLADYLRRLAVCDELHRIAFENGDTELANRADVLQMRAKDIWVQRTNRAGGMSSFDEERLESHLAPKGASLTPLTAGARNRSGTDQASVEGGK